MIFGAHSSEHEDFPKIISKKHFDRALKLMDASKTVFGGVKILEDKIDIDKILVVTFTNAAASEMRERILDAIYKKMEEKIINNISFGSGAINDALIHITNYNAPFGGVGASGMGAYHGKYSFETFSHQKHIYKKYSFFDNKLRFFPKKDKEKIIRFWFYK